MRISARTSTRTSRSSSRPSRWAGARPSGRLNSTPARSFTLDFYSNAACVGRPQDFLQGRTYLGSAQVTTDGRGNGALDVTVLPVDRRRRERLRPPRRTRRATRRSSRSACRSRSTPASGPPAGGTRITIPGHRLRYRRHGDLRWVARVERRRRRTTTRSRRRLRRLPPGSLNDVIVTNTDGTTGTLPKGWVADFLDVPGGHSSTRMSRRSSRNAITVGVGGGHYGAAQDTSGSRWPSSCSRPKLRHLLHPPPCAGGLPRRALLLHFRRLDRGARRRGHHRRLRRRQLLPRPTPCAATRWRSSC